MHYKLHTVHCTLYTVHCTLYTILYTLNPKCFQAATGAGNEFKRVAKELITKAPKHDSGVGYALLGAFYAGEFFGQIWFQRFAGSTVDCALTGAFYDCENLEYLPYGFPNTPKSPRSKS